MAFVRIGRLVHTLIHRHTYERRYIFVPWMRRENTNRYLRLKLSSLLLRSFCLVLALYRTHTNTCAAIIIIIIVVVGVDRLLCGCTTPTGIDDAVSYDAGHTGTCDLCIQTHREWFHMFPFPMWLWLPLSSLSSLLLLLMKLSVHGCSDISKFIYQPVTLYFRFARVVHVMGEWKMSLPKMEKKARGDDNGDNEACTTGIGLRTPQTVVKTFVRIVSYCLSCGSGNSSSSSGGGSGSYRKR